MTSTTTLSGYTPPHVEYQPATVGDHAIHQRAAQLAADRGPATLVIMSPQALAAMHAGGGSK